MKYSFFTLLILALFTCSNTAQAQGCSGTYTLMVNIQPLAEAGFTFSITGNTATFSNTSQNATDYSWDFGDNSATSYEASPTYTFSGAGIFQVTMIASNGCSSDTVTQEVNLICANFAPSLTYVDTVPCIGSFYELNADDDQATYNWYHDGALIADVTGSYIQTYQPGSYWFTASNSNGCAFASDTVQLAFLALPIIDINPLNPLISAGQTLTLSATPGFLSYTWSGEISGPDLDVIQPGTYEVSVYDNNYCFNTANSTVTLDQNSLPYIVLVGIDTLTVENHNNAIAYQWYEDNTLLNGAVLGDYHPLHSGFYKTEVFYQNGFSAFTPLYHYINTGVNNLPSGEVISLYPNPAEKSVTLTLKIGEWKSGTLEVNDAAGKLVLSETLPAFSGSYQRTLDVSKWAKGIYMIHCNNGRNSYRQELIVK